MFIKNIYKDITQKREYKRYSEKEDRGRRLKAQIFAIFAIVLGAVYLVVLPGLINAEAHAMGKLFYVAEFLCYALLVFFIVSVWYPRYQREEGLTAEKDHSVDVFITCCGEPIEIIAKTVGAAAAIDYSNYVIYILDDGKSEDVADLASQYGARYLSRPERTDAKAGNLNFGLSHASGDLVLVLDADQVPQPEIIKKMVGYFNLEKIGYVQSRQTYFLPEDDPFFNQDEVFYGMIQMGRDNNNTVISCGSGIIYRRKALDDIGGFSTWNLVEDLHTSFQLNAKGWRSLYYSYPLSRGLAPDHVWAVFKQRRQWCTDTLRMFFWDNPLFKKGLNLRQRMDYFFICLNYIVMGWAVPFFFVVPVWSNFSMTPVLNTPVLHYLAFRSLYLVSSLVAFKFLSYQQPNARQFQAQTGYFPVYIYGTVQALFSRTKKPQYKPNTPKDIKRNFPEILAVFPHMLLIVLNIVSPFYAMYFFVPAHFVLVNCFFSAFAIWTLSSVVFATFVKKTWSKENNIREFYGQNTKTV
ncbi:MAG: glycosyltransferase [Nitrospiraceae bacterium]|nr:MAG: glycosyltransferase [Nitrospiraceae bacterium]